jgi:hypothetical protein
MLVILAEKLIFILSKGNLTRQRVNQQKYKHIMRFSQLLPAAGEVGALLEDFDS